MQPEGSENAFDLDLSPLSCSSFLSPSSEVEFDEWLEDIMSDNFLLEPENSQQTQTFCQAATAIQRFWRGKHSNNLIESMMAGLKARLKKDHVAWRDIPFQKFTRKNGYGNQGLQSTECNCNKWSKMVCRHPFLGAACPDCMRTHGFCVPRGRPNDEEWILNILPQ